jgi:superfamily II DNA or RNA helicase
VKLRAWQDGCITKAINHYKNNHSHFLVLATPGAGKTMMASILAKRLLDLQLIDLVICISPSIIISDDFRIELELQLGKKLDGKLGSLGRALTYQAMVGENEIWALFESHKVFVIFDEIHHCAGSEAKNANAWGQKIIADIQGRAAYTLALTGTPWRSDSIPIALAHYCENHLVHCDYSYGLSQAITDNVCRTPSITLIDNDKIAFNDSESLTDYKSFEDLLTHSNCSYQSVVENEDLIKYMLGKANQKLDTLRRLSPDAGGLVVASSVAHAKSIHYLLKDHFNEDADIATYMEDDAVSTIKRYKHSNKKWIISVGMISEGTNIPRLRVCCHLTRVKTELYFRQVLGRILRADRTLKSKGYLYIPAEPTLIEYSHRVAKDIPTENVVKFDSMPSTHKETVHKPLSDRAIASDIKLMMDMNNDHLLDELKLSNFLPSLSQTYESRLGMFGQFRQRALKLNGIGTD